MFSFPGASYFSHSVFTDQSLQVYTPSSLKARQREWGQFLFCAWGSKMSGWSRDAQHTFGGGETKVTTEKTSLETSRKVAGDTDDPREDGD